TQRTVVDHQPDAPEQAGVVPSAHLGQHRVFARAQPFGQLLIRALGQRQAGPDEPAQLLFLFGRQEGVHAGGPSEKPRSMRYARRMGRSSGSWPVSAVISARMLSIRARFGAVSTNHKL